MADITKCTNEQCTEKENCYRYKVEANEFWQSYDSFKDICNKENNYKMKIIIK